MNTSVSRFIGADTKADFKHLLEFGAWLICGSFLFLISRKLVWGRDETLLNAPMVLFAAIPYCLFYIAERVALFRTHHTNKLLAFSAFVPMWTASLLAFVILRGSMASNFYEDTIYASTNVGPGRYLILSAVYVAFGFLFVLCIDKLPSARRLTALSAKFAACALAIALFYVGVFLIP